MIHTDNFDRGWIKISYDSYAIFYHIEDDFRNDIMFGGINGININLNAILYGSHGFFRPQEGFR